MNTYSLKEFDVEDLECYEAVIETEADGESYRIYIEMLSEDRFFLQSPRYYRVGEKVVVAVHEVGADTFCFVEDLSGQCDVGDLLPPLTHSVVKKEVSEWEEEEDHKPFAVVKEEVNDMESF